MQSVPALVCALFRKSKPMQNRFNKAARLERKSSGRAAFYILAKIAKFQGLLAIISVWYRLMANTHSSP